MNDTPTPRVTVVGIGNILMRDDGIGPAVAERLEKSYDWGPEVEVFDAGAPGMELAYLIEDRNWLILVDALEAEGDVGSVKWFDHDQIVDGNVPIRVGPHDPGIREAILRLELIGHAPRRVELLGVVPETVDLGSDLSPGALKGVEAATVALLDRLEADGIRPRASLEAPAKPWWD